MSEFCANCAARLVGPFCAQCGQGAHESARSLGTLLQGGLHDVTHLDGRLWRTLGVLLFRPGRLTREYFANRRARYLPPFRTYLVLSIVQFALLGLYAHDTASRRQDTETTAAFAEATQEALRRCERNTPPRDFWGKQEVEICKRSVIDHGASIGRQYLATLPRGLILFLPLLAAAMLLMYWRPRRLYVEHLVFYLHAHAAAFVVLSILLLARIAALHLTWLGNAVSVLNWLAVLYLPFYVLLGLRTYYAQSWLRTVGKYLMLCVLYFLGIIAVFVGSGVYSLYAS